MAKTKKYKPEEFEEKIKEYFSVCLETKGTPTKGGLALHLDLTRESLGDYIKYEGYSDTLKKSYMLIEENWVQNLRNNNVAGTIFYLKNAFSEFWRDKQEQEHKFDFSDLIKGKTNV